MRVRDSCDECELYALALQSSLVSAPVLRIPRLRFLTRLTGALGALGSPSATPQAAQTRHDICQSLDSRYIQQRKMVVNRQHI